MNAGMCKLYAGKNIHRVVWTLSPTLTSMWYFLNTIQKERVTADSMRSTTMLAPGVWAC